MKRTTWVILLGLVFSILPTWGQQSKPRAPQSEWVDVAREPSARLTPEQLFRQVSPSVLVVEASGVNGTRQGSGVAVGTNVVVTNCHVIDPAYMSADVATVLLDLADRAVGAGDQNGWNAADVVSRRVFRRTISELNEATNAEGNAEARVTLRQGNKKWTAFALGRFAFNGDLCLVFTLFQGFQPIQRIRTPETLQVGERVFAVGAPEGLELSLSEGIVSRLETWKPKELTDKPGFVTRIQMTSVTRIQTTAPISPGSSGGGLFDQQGNLIGITTSSVVGGQNLNFALPAGNVMMLVNIVR